MAPVWPALARGQGRFCAPDSCSSVRRVHNIGMVCSLNEFSDNVSRYPSKMRSGMEIFPFLELGCIAKSCFFTSSKIHWGLYNISEKRASSRDQALRGILSETLYTKYKACSRLAASGASFRVRSLHISRSFSLARENCLVQNFLSMKSLRS